ncbi:MAG: FKBP-type peptidyl-prolyl cis-trans isomerase [Candidatus Pacearchaeota archaeon]
MTLRKGDFIEIEFTGRLKEGEVFDSNIVDDLKKLHEGHDHPIETKPFVFCLGEQMFLQSIDDFLIGKSEPVKPTEYEISLTPEKAFGLRNQKLIMRIPEKVFREHRVNPIQGEVFNFDGRLAKILSVSGGRIMADFNSPLAGKEVFYKVIVKRKVDDLNEKVKALVEFFFKKELNFEINDKKLLIDIDEPLKKYAEMFKDKFMELLGLELEVRGIKNNKTQGSEKTETVTEKLA